ncbi:excinuclease ABC subunit UvrC [Spiroplasma culicicola]|uniref:UvrABC system protein C n=1 Tax=Spiroplasma culicicola AES-1 TaxID=1276246 RepID=W6A6I7_9MOLU|nr:excinuclease ABC subunit UvrC [Spiroplasma culicicola]AHI52617.1 excinuclease ABC subunit C [Spiroplasma culicicola AES-1]
MNVEKILKNLPEKSGCYMYFNDKEQVIYVGKAKNLKKRVSSYFNKVHDFKTTQLVREINNLETIITNNEKESLLLEQNLIKKYKPRYNIVLNDDKKYPYIAVTNEKDPRYIYIRNFDSKNKISFGPLPEGSSARSILNTLERIYPLRRCTGYIGKPCLYYHINQCSGACFKEVEPNYYQNMILKVKDFFDGNSSEVKELLEEKMLIASDNLQFEEAQRIKEIIQHLSFTLTKQNVDLNDNLNRDIFNYYEDFDYFCFTVLFYRKGQLVLKNQELIKNNGQNIEELFLSFINQIYAKNLIPDYIVIPKTMQMEELNLVFNNKILTEDDQISHNLLKLALDNSKEYLVEKIYYKDNQSITKEEVLKDLQATLKLQTFPYHIEMFDIANILDELVTGAMVVYKNGLPSKNDFRKYNIDIEESGDYHRIKEAVYRRYREAKNLPDLLIMDGAISQVHAAKEALKKLNLTIPIIGLVKNDHHKTDHILDLEEKPLFINKDTQVFKFLENIQLRVHNYAIAGFRKRFVQNNINDVIVNNIKGIGQVKIKKLYEKFNTIENIKNANYEQLFDIIKNKVITNQLIEFLKEYKTNG